MDTESVWENEKRQNPFNTESVHGILSFINSVSREAGKRVLIFNSVDSPSANETAEAVLPVPKP